MLRINKVLGLRIFFLVSVFLQARGNSVLWKEAESYFDRGDYERALTTYNSILASQGSDLNGYLLYNLGNTYYRLGKIGEAMASFLAARKLLPRNPDIQANLKFLSSRITDKLSYNEKPSLWSYLKFWQNSFTSKELYYCFVFFIFFSFLLLSVYILKRKYLYCLNSAKIFFLISVFSLSLFSVSYFSESHWAAVKLDRVKVLSGPGNLNTSVFELHKAAPLKILKEKNRYFLIEISDGKKGWVPLDSLHFFSY